MKRFGLLLVVCLGFAAAASAQVGDIPKVEAFGGYSYFHFEDPGNYLGIDNEDGIGALRANLNGGSLSVAVNPFKYVGFVGDFGAYVSGNNSGLAGSSVYTYMFGPRLALRRGRFTPFVQGLVGGAHLSAPSLDALAWSAGAGLDANLTTHFGVRVFQADYIRTYFDDGITGAQNSVRLSAGIVVRF